MIRLGRSQGSSPACQGAALVALAKDEGCSSAYALNDITPNPYGVYEIEDGALAFDRTATRAAEAERSRVTAGSSCGSEEPADKRYCGK